MTYRYLTVSYVQWLGLQDMPLLLTRDTAVSFQPGGFPLPRRYYTLGVSLSGRLYKRAADGLSYDLLP